MQEIDDNKKLLNMNVLLNNVRQELGNSYNYGYYSSYYYKEANGFKKLWTKTKGAFKPKKLNWRFKEISGD